MASMPGYCLDLDVVASQISASKGDRVVLTASDVLPVHLFTAFHCRVLSMLDLACHLLDTVCIQKEYHPQTSAEQR